MKKLNYLKRSNTLFLLLIVAASFIPIHAQNAWERMASMDIARGPVSCVIDSMIYVFGGAPASVYASLDSADAYNTKTNEWSDLAAMPDDLYAPAVDVINGKIYVLGGWQNTGGDNWATVNSVFEYDPARNTWEVKNLLPYPIGSWSSCVLNDSIFLVGGSGDFTPYGKDVRFYTPETEVWTSLPDMISDRQGGAVVEIIDNRIYVFGGTTNNGWYGPSGKNEVYDLASNTWSELSVMPVPVQDHIGVAHNQKIIVFGGDYQSSLGCEWGCSSGTNCIQEYDPGSNSWRLMKPMPFKRSTMAGEKAGNYVYLIGGYLNGRDLDQPLDEVWRFNLDSLQEGCDEVIIQDPSKSLVIGDTYALHADVQPSEFANKAIVWSSDNEAVATVSEEGIVSCMGAGAANITATLKYGGCTASCLVSVFPQTQNAWEQMEDMPQATSWFGSCNDSLNEKAYIFGGQDATATLDLMSTTQIYDFKTDEWTMGTDMTNNTSAFSAEMLNGKIYTFGEFTSPRRLTNVMEYDPGENSWETLGELPEIFWSHGSCVYDGLIYQFGGYDTDVNPQKSVRTYDPATDSWRELPDMLLADTKPAVCVYEDDIYLFNEKGQKFSPSDSSWTLLNTGTNDIIGFAVPIVHENAILLFGGYRWSQAANYYDPASCVYAYYPEEDTMMLLDIEMPFDRFTRGHRYKNYAYLFGGHFSSSMGSVTNEVWRFDLATPMKPKIMVTGVSLDQHDLNLSPNDNPSATLIATITPANASDQSVSWSSSDQGVATVDQEGNVTGVAEGEAKIMVTTTDGSFTDECSVEIIIIGINKNMADRIVLFPNPTNKLLTIQTTDPGIHSLEITSLNGRLIYSGEMEGTTHQIDLSSFRKGVYFITIRSGKFVTTRKIIKL